MKIFCPICDKEIVNYHNSQEDCPWNSFKFYGKCTSMDHATIAINKKNISDAQQVISFFYKINNEDYQIFIDDYNQKIDLYLLTPSSFHKGNNKISIPMIKMDFKSIPNLINKISKYLIFS